MNLSPNDIRNYEFPNQMRGYDKEEVDSFMDQVATALENMKQDTLKLSMENDSLKSQLENLKKYEDSIKHAAIDARKNADATMLHAKENAEEFLASAKVEAEELVASKEAMVAEYKKQIERLHQTKESYTSEIKDMINVHLSMINKIADTEFSYTSDSDENQAREEYQADSNDSGSINVTESSEVERDKMNTVGTEASNEPIVTEDANAAEAVVETPKEGSIDPELAAALEGFENPEPTSENVSPDTMIGTGSVPKQGSIVETNKRAEDIPEGFIVGDSIDEPIISTDEDTGKLDVDADTNKVQTQPQAITTTEEDKKISPENIVDELDNVVAKFEEEIEKAESSS